MHQIAYGPYKNVEFLLEDPRFRATANEDVKPRSGIMALYAARGHLGHDSRDDDPSIFLDPLEAGADPTVDNGDYSTTLEFC